MKVLMFVLATCLFISCSTENKQQQLIRELAKRDAIEKLQLPEGTKFNDDNIEVIETENGDGVLGFIYLIKITVKSQDRDGNEVLKTHTMNYKKIGEGGLSPKDYELISFE